MTEDEFRSLVTEEGYREIRAISYEPHHAPDPHTHEFDATGLVLSGTLQIVLDDSSATFAIGDVYEVPAGTRHAEHTADAATSVLVGIRPV